MKTAICLFMALLVAGCDTRASRQRRVEAEHRVRVSAINQKFERGFGARMEWDELAGTNELRLTIDLQRALMRPGRKPVIFCPACLEDISIVDGQLNAILTYEGGAPSFRRIELSLRCSQTNESALRANGEPFNCFSLVALVDEVQRGKNAADTRVQGRLLALENLWPGKEAPAVQTASSSVAGH